MEPGNEVGHRRDESRCVVSTATTELEQSLFPIVVGKGLLNDAGALTGLAVPHLGIREVVLTYQTSEDVGRLWQTLQAADVAARLRGLPIPQSFLAPRSGTP